MQDRVREYLGRMTDLAPATVDVVVDEIGPPRDAHRRSDRRDAADHADGVPRLRVVAVGQGRAVDKRRWIQRRRGGVGRLGDVYDDDDGRLLGSMQYGPSDLFPRAAELPAGPPSDDAVLVTCAYLVDPSKPWVLQSLFLTAIGDARDKGARRSRRSPTATRSDARVERFLVHKTIFPRDFLSDFGFVTVRAQGRVELARLELGGLAAGRRGHAREGARASCARRSCPAPAPHRP